MDELIAAFDLDAVNKSGCAVDENKVDVVHQTFLEVFWLNFFCSYNGLIINIFYFFWKMLTSPSIHRLFLPQVCSIIIPKEVSKEFHHIE